MISNIVCFLPHNSYEHIHLPRKEQSPSLSYHSRVEVARSSCSSYVITPLATKLNLSVQIIQLETWCDFTAQSRLTDYIEMEDNLVTIAKQIVHLRI